MSLAAAVGTENPRAIQQVFVQRLFGQFSYSLGTGDDGGRLSNLLILYGDNGSGKTTILQLIIHLLSHEASKGHKNFVARTPFERFVVVFADGTCVEARREQGRLLGSYSAIISKRQEVLQTLEFRTGENGELLSNRDEDEAARQAEFLQALRELNISLHYLADDRKLYEEEAEKARRRRTQRVLAPMVHSARDVLFWARNDVTFNRHERDMPPLYLAMDRAIAWIRDKAYSGIGAGERDTNNIYTDVIKVIAESQEAGSEEDAAVLLHQLRENLQSLSKRSKAYSMYGLMSPLQVNEVLGTIKRIEGVDLNKSKIIYNIMKPYTESFEARLKALSELYSAVETFVDTLNGFFLNKRIEFNLRNGFKIQAENGDRISPSWLSSGEKQILLLFCNTLASKDQAAIFIIDEPEISLNIKWQRRLVQSLLRCIEGSPVQFVLATHSIELLAQHRSSVVMLQNLEKQKTTDVCPPSKDAQLRN